MPTQEDRAVTRIRMIQRYLQDNPNGLAVADLDAWCLINYGIRPKTVSTYLNALQHMGLIQIEDQTIKYIGGEQTNGV